MFSARRLDCHLNFEQFVGGAHCLAVLERIEPKTPTAISSAISFYVSPPPGSLTCAIPTHS
ncbi:hypothetical protein NY08_2262 [Rhodococcus sp. B7740]|nr:hypothetical protein NY08_2262 [Rhodococcus sp. B7740]